MCPPYHVVVQCEGEENVGMPSVPQGKLTVLKHPWCGWYARMSGYAGLLSSNMAGLHAQHDSFENRF